MEGLDGLIDKLLETKNNRGKRIQLGESEIRNLCTKAKDVFMNQPNLLELEAPINICGISPYIYSLCFFTIANCLIFIPFRSRRYTRPISRPIASIRVRWVSSGFELPISWRLRRQRKTKYRNNMSPSLIQDQIS